MYVFSGLSTHDEGKKSFSVHASKPYEQEDASVAVSKQYIPQKAACNNGLVLTSAKIYRITKIRRNKA